MTQWAVHVKANPYYFLILLVSVVLVGGSYGWLRSDTQGVTATQAVYQARVTALGERQVHVQTNTLSGVPITHVNLGFSATLTQGADRGRVVQGSQTTVDFGGVQQREVAVGDRVVLQAPASIGLGVYVFHDYDRMNQVGILTGLLVVGVVVFAGFKGLNALIALGLTLLAVFGVLIPAIMAGHSVYVVTLVVVGYVIVSSLLLIVGLNKKALATILGCGAGVLVSSLLMVLMSHLLHLTGAVDSETRSFLSLHGHQIDIRAVVFAGVIIGCTGAIMDVAMSITSALWEIKMVKPGVTGGELWTAGIGVGKDTLGTMLNTLILAYVGTSLVLLLQIQAHSLPTTAVMNTELMVIEFLRAILGSFGILAAMPVTAWVCVRLYAGQEV